MKLYATTTSERASKGQGGNEFLEIKLTVSKDEVSAGRIIVEAIGLGARVYYIPPAGATKADGVLLSTLTPEYIRMKTKGERQKGERNHKCNYCNAITKTYLENWHCSNCSRDN